MINLPIPSTLPRKCSSRIYFPNVMLIKRDCSLSLRVFDDAEGAMWRQSVKDISGDVLCISQFTLLANTVKGSKPDFHRAMVRPTLACPSLHKSTLPFREVSSPRRCTRPFCSGCVNYINQVISRVRSANLCTTVRTTDQSNVTSDGKFGAMMNVSLTNEGPVTFTLDSRKFEYVQPSDGKSTKPSMRALDGEVVDN